MPALTVFGNFTTRPFAGDDLQLICIVLAAYRGIQLVCLVPILICMLVRRFNGTDVYINGYGHWCPQYGYYQDENYLFLAINDANDEDGIEFSRSRFSSITFGLAFAFIVLDVSWIIMIWVTAITGTPTNGIDRDVHQRKLIIFKMLVLNMFPLVLLITGILYVEEMRYDNYGCGIGVELVDYDPEGNFAAVLYKVLLVTYALELLVFPSIIVNRIILALRRNDAIRSRRYATKAKGERLENCLGMLLRCISLCCKGQGGKEIKNRGEMKDFASNLASVDSLCDMEFANNETKVNVTLSDVYVGGMILSRVQAERMFDATILLQLAMNTTNSVDDNGSTAVAREDGTGSGEAEAEAEAKEEAGGGDAGVPPPSFDRGALLNVARRLTRRRSILTLQHKDDGGGCIVVPKNVLDQNNPIDVETLRNAAHYSKYAECAYHYIPMALMDLLPKDATRFIRDFDKMNPMPCFSLEKYDVPYAQLYYSNVYNGITATPYSILVDERERSVVITVRGTNSLEDWVMDLQYVPQPLDKVGELCGFDGHGHHCHKGVLTRCKWMYNDIKKNRVLKNLYASSSPYEEYNLVVVGHSLGGGCAQVLSLMLRPSFPSLRCFAYEPPGCIFDDSLSEDCKEWITSTVRHDDVVPRVTQQNLEVLRDEFFDIIARIKVSKSKAFYDVRAPCPQTHLASRNAKLLCPKGQIDRDTEFYKAVQAFRNERARKNKIGEISVKLYIPGQIIHLVDTLGDETKYVAYWASRYDFKQVILSKRMLSDHDIPSLVDILRNLKLDDVHEVQTWQEDDGLAEGEEIEILLIAPFSNPQGKVPLALVIIGIIAIILAVISNQGCHYVTRSSVIEPSDGGLPYTGLGSNVGLWSYNMKQCVPGEICNSTDKSTLGNYEDSPYCQPMPELYGTGAYWSAARAFGTSTVFLGFCCTTLVSIATWTKLKSRTWFYICALFIIITIFQGLQFLFLKSDLCSVWTFPYNGDVIISKCTLSSDGYFGVAATVLWIIIASGCSHMTRQARDMRQ